METTLGPAPGRKRTWKAPNGENVVLPVEVTASETDPITGEHAWTVTATVELIDRQPRTTSVHVQAADGIDQDRLQREFRWRTPADIVTLWMPEQLAAGRDPFAQRPPSNWWIAETRHELTDDFLATIAGRYLELGRGYVQKLAAEYSTSPRTVRSWIDKARERGILGPSVGQGKIGAAPK